MHPSLEARAHAKSTNGTNGHRPTARSARRSVESADRRGSKEKAENPFVEKGRAWGQALKGGAVLSLVTFALVAASQGFSKPAIGAKDADTVAYSLAFLGARPDESSNRPLAAWPLEDEGGARTADLATAHAGARALPDSSEDKS